MSADPTERADGRADELAPALRAAVDLLRAPAAAAPDALARATDAALAAHRAAADAAPRRAAARGAWGRRVGRAAAVLAVVGMGGAVWRAREPVGAAAPVSAAVGPPAVGSSAADSPAGVGFTPAAASSAALDEAPRVVRFAVRAPAARRVAVVGDFNRWDPAATPLVRGPAGWEVEVPLAPGRHAYAFVVDGGRWVLDPAAPSERDPDFGRPHSVTVVGLEARP